MSFFGLTKPEGEVESITVRLADGSGILLGKPNTLMFKIRLKIYLFKRRKELKQ